MKVLLDARKLGDGGIGVYIENLVDGLLEIRESDGLHGLELSLLFSPTDGHALKTAERWNKQVELYEESAGKYSLNEYFLLPQRHRRLIESQDVYHSPHYTLPFGLNVPSVATIHDVIHITHPETKAHRLMGSLLIKSALKRADRIVTVSNATKSRLLELVPERGARYHVVPNSRRRLIVRHGIEEAKRLKQLHIGDRKYVLFVGSERPHKGFARLACAWAKLCKKLESRTNLVLAVVGREFGCDSRELVEKLGIANRVRFLGEISCPSLSALYQESELVTVPSTEEGFGLVALEALTCGAQVLCTPVNSLKEVCGDYAHFAKNFSPDALFEELSRIIIDKPQPISINRGWLERFSRAKNAEKMVEIYRSAMNRGLPLTRVGADWRELEIPKSAVPGGAK